MYQRKKALLESDTLELTESAEARGSVVAENPVESLKLRIEDESGQLVRTSTYGFTTSRCYPLCMGWKK